MTMLKAIFPMNLSFSNKCPKIIKNVKSMLKTFCIMHIWKWLTCPCQCQIAIYHEHRNIKFFLINMSLQKLHLLKPRPGLNCRASWTRECKDSFNTNLLIVDHNFARKSVFSDCVHHVLTTVSDAALISHLLTFLEGDDLPRGTFYLLAKNTYIGSAVEPNQKGLDFLV